MSEILRVDALNPEAEPLQRAAALVLSAGLVVYPTETLYGIGADAMNEQAVALIPGAKQREGKKPILVIIPSMKDLPLVAAGIPDSARQLMDLFWPGPLTLVLDATPGLPDLVTGGTKTVGVRVPSSPVSLLLLKLCGCPLTSTSANRAGEAPSRSIDGIRRVLGEAIGVYLDAGELPVSEPSTVVDARDKLPRLIRPGAIPFERVIQAYKQSLRENQ